MRRRTSIPVFWICFLGCFAPGRTEAPAAKRGLWSGAWITDDQATRRGGFHGRIELAPRHGRIEGRFGEGQWRLEGIPDGRILRGRWWWIGSGDRAYEETQPVFRGTFEWALSPDGASFSGWGAPDEGVRQTWTGRRGE